MTHDAPIVRPLLQLVGLRTHRFVCAHPFLLRRRWLVRRVRNFAWWAFGDDRRMP